MEGFLIETSPRNENHDSFSFHHFNEIVSQFTFPRENSLDGLNSFEMEEVRDWWEVDDNGSSHDHQVVLPNVVSMDVASIKPSLVLLTEDMQSENELGSNHLAAAYGEAMEKEHRELAEVIARRINEKVSPVGLARERLLYHSFHGLDKEAGGYIKHESSKVFHAAFESIYRSFVNGMFAHFGANSAILEARARDAEVLHIVDFDIGEGIQWASFIAALAQQHRFGLVPQQMPLKITSIRWKEENSTNASHLWRFEETKKRVQDYANFQGLKLKVEEIELQDLVKEIKIAKQRREWMAFNCIWALPHMGRRRSRGKAVEFLTAAKGFLVEYSESYGIITYGDGENSDRIIKNRSGFGSLFESYKKHYQTVLESMERSFPPRLAEARIAMESLFVAPYVFSQALHDLWRETKELELVCGGFQPAAAAGFGLKVSSERLMEAKVMVREERVCIM